MFRRSRLVWTVALFATLASTPCFGAKGPVWVTNPGQPPPKRKLTIVRDVTDAPRVPGKLARSGPSAEELARREAKAKPLRVTRTAADLEAAAAVREQGPPGDKVLTKLVGHVSALREQRGAGAVHDERLLPEGAPDMVRPFDRTDPYHGLKSGILDTDMPPGFRLALSLATSGKSKVPVLADIAVATLAAGRLPMQNARQKTEEDRAAATPENTIFSRNQAYTVPGRAGVRAGMGITLKHAFWSPKPENQVVRIAQLTEDFQLASYVDITDMREKAWINPARYSGLSLRNAGTTVTLTDHTAPGRVKGPIAWLYVMNRKGEGRLIRADDPELVPPVRRPRS
jgi:hypothetical protein